MKKEFEIIESRSDFEFKERVQQMLNEGWDLYGPLIAFPDHRNKDDESIMGIYYIQALVKLT